MSQHKPTSLGPASIRATPSKDHPARPLRNEPDARSPGRAAAEPPAKTKVSFYLPTETVQQLKDAVKATASRHDVPDGQSAMADAALTQYVRELQQRFNNGQPFERYTGNLKPGRRG